MMLHSLKRVVKLVAISAKAAVCWLVVLPLSHCVPGNQALRHGWNGLRKAFYAVLYRADPAAISVHSSPACKPAWCDIESPRTKHSNIARILTCVRLYYKKQ